MCILRVWKIIKLIFLKIFEMDILRVSEILRNIKLIFFQTRKMHISKIFKNISLIFFQTRKIRNIFNRVTLLGIFLKIVYNSYFKKNSIF